ncbi:Intradiol ring-cleavage dioxygenase [Lentinula aciculospora]|uniref:Intradiol ring-cleavage dioxygenase n=1 Tax=Lentinula aciculospora TaxID=153920 RepID=A0A9W9A4I0_9AGAR|nr:Intradiol ring-cleavage dioxygenase [Lentinula aciculospora]
MVCTHFLISLLSLVSATGVSAHQEPKTDAEIETQRALQRAAYYCAPAVGEFTAARKRAWQQQVLAGSPSLPTNEDLFSSGIYSSGSRMPSHKKQEILSCNVVEEETEIQNNSCVLTPIVTEGPYYHRSGHPIRQNIADYQIGLLTYLDIGVIDINTCKPLPNVLVDIWQANATGHYAGHPEPAPHLANEQPQVGGKRSGLLSAFPRTNFHEQWLRGAWQTDSHGVARFTTIFPGYYTGRATHVHTKVFTSWTENPNGTFDGGKLAHVGQFFFEDDLNMQVDKMYPYVENPIRDIRGRTRNWRDSLNIFEDSHGPEGEYNPVFKMHLLGGVINQGLVGFITMGINASYEMDNWWKG